MTKKNLFFIAAFLTVFIMVTEILTTYQHKYIIFYSVNEMQVRK